MKEMINSLVFREEPLTDVQVKHRYEHNERTAKVYANENINLALSGNNIHLKADNEPLCLTNINLINYNALLFF